MKTYKDLPNPIKTESGESIFIQGYILEAQCETSRNMNEAFADKILNHALRFASEFVSSQFIGEWLFKAHKLYGSPQRTTKQAGTTVKTKGDE